jgi:hypothetical protein
VASARAQVDEEGLEEEKKFPAHFRNESVSVYWRYGIVIYLLAVLSLLLTSDIGSGVVALTKVVPSANDNFTKAREQVLLEASVFTSVKELWNLGSYGLAILIVVTSIMWPYVKLLLSLYAWMWPFRTARGRERLLVLLDVLGKWSFVDVVVFIEIMVVFRATIPLGGPTLEVWIAPRWGFFGFVAATMLSLIGTHAILFHHRRIVYGTITSNLQGLQNIAGITTIRTLLMSFLLLAAAGIYFAGCCIGMFRILNSRGNLEIAPVDYSLIDVGRDLSDAGQHPDDRAQTWLQIIWFTLAMAAPIGSFILFAVLLWAPWKGAALRKILFLAEISFAWNCAEVVFVSTIFAVLEVPTFGEGLIDSGCDTCYSVDSKLLNELAVLGVGTLLSVLANALIFQRAHQSLYCNS